MPEVILKKKFNNRAAGSTMKVSGMEARVLTALGYVAKPPTKAELEKRAKEAQDKAKADAAAARVRAKAQDTTKQAGLYERRDMRAKE